MRKILVLPALCLIFSSVGLGQSRDQSANGLELKGLFTPARAMKLIYGSYDNSGRTSQWMPKTTKSYPNSWPDNVEAEDGCSGKVKADMIDYCVAYDGDLDVVPDPQSDYYDLLLTKSVYRSWSKKIPVGTTVTRYRFDGSKYVPEK
jgi:hypothetical protein